MKASSCGRPKGGGLPVWVLGKGLTTTYFNKSTCHKTLHTASDSEGSLGTTQAMENGHEVCFEMGLKEIVWMRVEWINVVQYREKLRAVVNTEMGLRIA